MSSTGLALLVAEPSPARAGANLEDPSDTLGGPELFSRLEEVKSKTVPSRKPSGGPGDSEGDGPLPWVPTTPPGPGSREEWAAGRLVPEAWALLR